MRMRRTFAVALAAWARAEIVIKLQFPRAHLVGRLNASIATLKTSGVIAAITSRCLRDGNLIPDVRPS